MTQLAKWPTMVAVGVGVTVVLLQWSAMREQARTRDAVDRLTHALERSAQISAQSARPTTGGTVVGGCDSISRAELRSILKDELQELGRRPESEPDSGPPPVPSTVDVDVEGERVAAFERAQGVVTSALAAHVWGTADVEAFRDVARKLTSEQRATLTRQLFPAINNQQIRVEVDGPLF